MLIGQEGSTGGTTRKELKVGQWEQKNSGKEEAHSSPFLPRSLKNQYVICPSVTEEVAETFG